MRCGPNDVRVGKEGVMAEQHWPDWSPERATLFGYCSKCRTPYLDCLGKATACPCIAEDNWLKHEYAERVVVGEPARAQLNLARKWIGEALVAPPADLRLALEQAGWTKAVMTKRGRRR